MGTMGYAMEPILDREMIEGVKENLRHNEVASGNGSKRHPLTGFYRMG
jgi:hypothetical protein